MLDHSAHHDSESLPFADLPRNHFGAILADPPWRFEAWSGKGTARAADNHYRTMGAEDLAALPVEFRAR